ncbi:glycogen/starch/alpha-glucan phosphorylase [Pseudoalteromonas sp. ACER1]|nr:glycogen/starch/alpha-glucan phosphorylase [Pseudoalteromonas sp. PAST1]MCO7211968.1 glycogen/starch/alpha-glucan phosphorylase [Pseudoalteromonas sp. ACER1]
MFSSDRTISQYSDDIWHLEPLMDTSAQQNTQKKSS